METSDSENFESADEGLDPEYIPSKIKERKNEKTTKEKTETQEQLQEEEEKLKRTLEIEHLSKEIIEKFSTKCESNNKPIKPSKIGFKKEKKIKPIKTIDNEPPPKEDVKRDQEAVEENMWADDEDWGEASVAVKTKDPKKKEKSYEKPEENLWEDEEKWQDEAEEKRREKWQDERKTKRPENWQNGAEKNKPEENLWTEVEDWGEPKEETISKDNWAQWGSWSNWNNVLSKATQSVSTITNQVSQGITTAIGVPDPEELAKMDKEEKAKLQELIKEQEQEKPGSTLLNFGGFLKLVETTGTKVISGGLDTLETIGKKTMEVLQEGDPGLKKKRAFLKIDSDKPVLSQLLREAKEKNERENKEQRTEFKKKNYESLFDDHQGLVHLEALEMLSKQCDIKLQNILETYQGDALIDMQETLNQIKELCELPEEEEEENANLDEFKEKLQSAVKELNVNISYSKLLETWSETDKWLNEVNLQICDERELHQQAIETLAQLTAFAVEQFHKTGELLLIKDRRSTVDEADSLVQLTTTLTSFIGIVAAKFSDKLNLKATSTSDKELVNSLITNVFYEAGNSSSYIQDAFQLLIPVLQVGAI